MIDTVDVLQWSLWSKHNITKFYTTCLWRRLVSFSAVQNRMDVSAYARFTKKDLSFYAQIPFFADRWYADTSIQFCTADHCCQRCPLPVKNYLGQKPYNSYSAIPNQSLICTKTLQSGIKLKMISYNLYHFILMIFHRNFHLMSYWENKNLNTSVCKCDW